MSAIRRCREDERPEILTIVNRAAEAYRGVIPADRWREPYMPQEQLDADVAAGVAFWGYEDEGELCGVMGLQRVREVHLIRHSYVLPERQGEGIGRALLEHVRSPPEGPLLVGTWAAAEWAIRFYERNGFERVPPARARGLLARYWAIPERQVETSVVLTSSRAAD